MRRLLPLLALLTALLIPTDSQAGLDHYTLNLGVTENAALASLMVFHFYRTVGKSKKCGKAKIQIDHSQNRVGHHFYHPRVDTRPRLSVDCARLIFYRGWLRDEGRYPNPARNIQAISFALPRGVPYP